MKKLIVVVMALITIFSASVSAHAEQYVDWQIVDTITNIVYDSYNCCLTFHNTASPTPTMTNASGARGTQKTTYNVLYSLYETVSVNGASFQSNVILGGVFEWYEYGGYCWIKYDVDNSTNTFWVANKQGKILYCDAPTTSNGYTISAIAGVSNYYLTNRPVNTSGGGYSGDLALTYSNWLNIKETLNNLSGDQSFYTYGHSINGEFRYYLAYRPNTYTYYVCDSAGRLFYTVKESADSGGSGDGSSFDATEVITAINSVYDALDYGFWDVCNWLEAIQDNISSFNTDVLIMSQNMTNGFADLRNVGNTINTTLGTINSNLLHTGSNITSALEKYFHSLGKSYPQLMTVKLSGNDNLFEWDDGDIIQDIRASNPDGEVHIKKTFLGDDSSGYTDVTLVNSDDNYKLIKDASGFYRICCLDGISASLFNNYGYCDLNTGEGVPSDTYRCTWFLVYNEYSYTLNLAKRSHFISCYDVDHNYLGYVNGSNTFPDDTVYIRYNWHLSVSEPPFYRHDYGYISADLFTINGFYNLTTGNLTVADYYKCSPLYLLTEYNYVVNLPNSQHFVSCFDGNKNYLGYANGLSAIPAGTVYVAYNWSSNDSLFPPFASRGTLSSFRAVFNYGDGNHELSVSLSHGDRYCDYIYYDVSSAVWKVYRHSSDSFSVLSDSDQDILNQTYYTPPNINTVPISDFTASSAPPLFYDGLNHIDIDGDTVVTIEYYHNGSWFDYMYSMMDKLYERIGQVDGAVVNIENTVVDIVQDNDAFNVFYVEKSDGTTESVGDAATDAAVFVGDVLSMFYRLVFSDALDNVDILEDFEGVYSNTEVSVW